MVETIISHSFSALIFLSLITFIEITINFRRPLILKSLLLTIVFIVGFSSAGNLYCLTHSYNRWLLELPNTLLAVSALYFYSLLANKTIRPLFLWVALVTIIIQVSIYLIFEILFKIGPEINLLESKVYLEINFLTRTILSVFFAYFVIKLYMELKTKYAQDNIYFKQIRSWSIYCLIGLSIELPNKLFKVLGIIGTNTFLFVHIAIYFLIVLSILFRPRFLNRTHLKVALSQLFNRQLPHNSLVDRFEAAFYNDLYYLNNKSSAEQFAKTLEITTDQLNRFIFTKYQSNFSDLVNKARIDYFVNLISQGNQSNYTIEYLAQLSGFGSRQNLYKQFRKFHGGSPSDLLNAVHR